MKIPISELEIQENPNKNPRIKICIFYFLVNPNKNPTSWKNKHHEKPNNRNWIQENPNKNPRIKICIFYFLVNPNKNPTSWENKHHENPNIGIGNIRKSQ